MSWGKLIGICGRKRAGKDSVAQCLIDIDDSFMSVAFASPMKKMAVAMDPFIVFFDTDMESWDVADCERFLPDGHSVYARLSMIVNEVGWERAKSLPDVRRFLQRLGTEGGRDVLGQDIWVDTALNNEIIPALNSGHNVVVTDVRFKNEIRAIRQRGGELWRVERNALGPDVDHHASEMEWRSATPDRWILNNGTLEELRARVQRELADR